MKYGRGVLGGGYGGQIELVLAVVVVADADADAFLVLADCYLAVRQLWAIHWPIHCAFVSGQVRRLILEAAENPPQESGGGSWPVFAPRPCDYSLVHLDPPVYLQVLVQQRRQVAGEAVSTGSATLLLVSAPQRDAPAFAAAGASFALSVRVWA